MTKYTEKTKAQLIDELKIVKDSMLEVVIALEYTRREIRQLKAERQNHIDKIKELLTAGHPLK